jgi:preprotein translocase subunit SecG
MKLDFIQLRRLDWSCRNMGTVGIILLVAFIVVCVLLIFLVIVQDDGENGMGGLLGGRGTAAFGSHSASVLTKTTTVLVILFFALAFGLALVNKKPKLDKDLIPTAAETTQDSTSSVTAPANEWWNSEETAE